MPKNSVHTSATPAPTAPNARPAATFSATLSARVAIVNQNKNL